MKIAFLHYTIGIIDRGSEISTQILAGYLGEKDHLVWLLQLGEDNKQNNYKTKKINLLLKPKFKKSHNMVEKILQRVYLDYNSILTLIFSIKSIPTLIKIKPDIVIPTNGFWQIIICKLISIFTKSKLVVIGRAGIGWTDKDNLKLNPDLFIGLTSEACNWAKKINHRAKSIYIPNPIDILGFKSQNKDIKIELKKPIILSVAALSPYKNLDILIEAVNKLSQASLLIAGRGELHKSLYCLGKKLLGSGFAIKNFNHREMHNVYKQCDVFVLISDKQEAFGRVLLEAMSVGLPIVTQNFKQRREIIGDLGFYINDLNAETVANAMKQALNFKNNKLMIKQVQKYDIKTIGPKYEQALTEIIDK